MDKIRWSSPSREVMQGVKFVDGIREEDDASLGSYTKFGSNSILNGKRLKTNNRGKTKKIPLQ